MKIELRLFASLRQKLPAGSSAGQCDLELPDGATVGEVLKRIDIPPARAQMILVNGDQGRDLDRILQNGDVLSIFPPLAGGSAKSSSSVWRRGS